MIYPKGVEVPIKVQKVVDAATLRLSRLGNHMLCASTSGSTNFGVGV